MGEEFAKFIVCMCVCVDTGRRDKVKIKKIINTSFVYLNVLNYNYLFSNSLKCLLFDNRNPL